MTNETSETSIRVETLLGPLTWQSDQTGFEVMFPGRTARSQWNEVTAAGLVASAMPMARAGVPAEVLGGLGKYLPGLGQLTRINEHLAENYRMLVLARGPRDARAIRIPLPLSGEEAAELVQEVHHRLADRWIGDIEIGDSYRRLGLRQPWWTIPLSILFFIALGLTITLTCVGVTAISGGEYNLPLPVWIGMALWFILTGAIIFLYRRLWLR